MAKCCGTPDDTSDVNDLLREMDRDGDGWYGRATHALQAQRLTITRLERERLSLIETGGSDGSAGPPAKFGKLE